MLLDASNDAGKTAPGLIGSADRDRSASPAAAVSATTCFSFGNNMQSRERSLCLEVRLFCPKKGG
jgi:hypothetical protein